MKRSRIALIMCCVLALPAQARALTTSYGIATWMGSSLQERGVRVMPSLALDEPHAWLAGGPMLAERNGEVPYAGAKLAGAALLRPASRMPLEMRLLAVHRNDDEAAREVIRGEARIELGDGRQGAWMGVAAEGIAGDHRDAKDRSFPMIGFGLWTRTHRALLRVDLEQHSGMVSGPVFVHPLAPIDSARPPTVVIQQDVPMRTTLTTTSATMGWGAGRLQLESVGGITLSLLRGPRRWAQARASFQLGPDLAAFATVGSRAPELYLIEPAVSPRVTMGVTLSHWRSADRSQPLLAHAVAEHWSARRVDEGEYLFDVRAPGARLVQVRGDFTDWQSLPLRAAGGDRWTVVVHLVPGIHQLDLRVDGGPWLPPPGVATTRDEYGGEIGIFVSD